MTIQIVTTPEPLVIRFQARLRAAAAAADFPGAGELARIAATVDGALLALEADADHRAWLAYRDDSAFSLRVVLLLDPAVRERYSAKLATAERRQAARGKGAA